MLVLEPVVFRFFSRAAVTPEELVSNRQPSIEQPSNRVSPPFKIYFPASAPAHKSQIVETVIARPQPRRAVTTMESHPCACRTA